jgi:hypothetical protein
MPHIVVLTLALAQLMASALAHDVAYRDLGGRTLCLDPRSVQIRVDDPSYAQAAPYARAVEETLGRALRATLDSYGVPYRERERCRTLFVRLGFDLLRRVDARERPYHWVLAELQVGRGTDGDEGGSSDLADQRFAGLAADAIYPPGSGIDYFASLPLYATELIDDLARSWWEDAEAAPPAPRWLPAAGAALALAVIATILLWGRVRRRRRATR